MKRTGLGPAIVLVMAAACGSHGDTKTATGDAGATTTDAPGTDRDAALAGADSTAAADAQDGVLAVDASVGSDARGGAGGHTTGSGGGSGGVGGAGAGGTSGSGGAGGKPVVLDASFEVAVQPDVALPDDGGVSDAGDQREIGCSTTVAKAMRAPSDLLLLLDRSASMNNSIDSDSACASATCTTRWSAVSTGLQAAFAQAPATRWGLKVFPSPLDSSCGVTSSLEVLLSSSTTAVLSTLADIMPGGNTPTAAAVAAATAYLKTVAGSPGRAVVLVTDGQPNCKAGTRDMSVADLDGTVAAVSAASASGFPVYVLGIGPSVGNLDVLAQAGGTRQYYPATTADQISVALDTITGAGVSCTFSLVTPPASPEAVTVGIGPAEIAKDAANGWSFGATPATIVLNGTACAHATDERWTSLDVILGCR